MSSGSGPREGRIRLADGRTLAYAEYGDPDGRPVLGCHGSPSSRLERHVEDPGDYRRGGDRIPLPEPPGMRPVKPRARFREVLWPGTRAVLPTALGADPADALIL